VPDKRSGKREKASQDAGDHSDWRSGEVTPPRDHHRVPHRDPLEGEFNVLTFDFERTPLEPSIQMYSAITWPFWESLRYFSSCKFAH
jgi:hypothetical protein